MAKDEGSAGRAEWPVKGATVALTKGKRPPTADGEINIGMDHTIHVPSEEAQRGGFTPYELVEGEAVDATRELLLQYPGVYKPIVQKGSVSDDN